MLTNNLTFNWFCGIINLTYFYRIEVCFMLDKLKIVLFKPRFIGLYIKENFLLLILKLLVTIFVCLLPTYFTICSINEISSDFRSYLTTNITSASIENTVIDNFVLKTENAYNIDGFYFDIIIGNEIEEDSYSSFNETKLIFDETKVTFYVSSFEFYSVSYEEMNLESLDFEQISPTNLENLNKFINVFNFIYKDNHNFISVVLCASVTLELIISVFGTALILAGISLIFNKRNVMPFIFRYKMCLNSQYIYLALILVGSLYGFDIVSYVATFVMSIYALVALNSITMVKKG